LGVFFELSGGGDSRGKNTKNFCLVLKPEGLYTGGESIDI